MLLLLLPRADNNTTLFNLMCVCSWCSATIYPQRCSWHVASSRLWQMPTQSYCHTSSVAWHYCCRDLACLVQQQQQQQVQQVQQPAAAAAAA
jgi:hypothetical protein